MISLQDTRHPGEKAVIDALAGRQFDEEQMRDYMLNTTNHVMRIEAFNILAKKSAKWLEDLGDSKKWQERAISAKYLAISGQKKEALRQLREEKVPMVQVMLMSALLGEGGVE